MKFPKFLRVLFNENNAKVKNLSAIKWVLLFPLLFSSLINYGQTFTSTGTWLCPAGVTSITIECWGGGGAGGGSITLLYPNAGAGGGGGGYTKTTSVSVTPGNTYNITVGQGGAGNANVFTGSINGNNGGDSYFGASIGIAHGGNGGGGNGGSAGVGGVGGTWNGGNGAAAKDNQNSGGGGGGAGSASIGGNANQLIPGSGGTGNSSGSGGAGISTNAAGNSGNIIGGGGGGAGQAGVFSAFTGGSGASGEVILTNTTPPTITGLSSNICVGGSITITGTNFVGITAANVTIGGTAVSSITSFTSTQIIAVVNSACTGNVKVTTMYGTATSAGTFTSNAPPSATILYAGTPFCKSVGTAQAVTQSGTSGGTYSALPSGLSINASTGAIIPSTSTAGTYTVTYTMAAAGGCSAQTATTSVTITAIPSATISYAGSPYCKSVGTAQAVTQSGTSGGTYSASPSGLSISASTGAITPSSSTAGTYTVTYTMAAAGGCSAQTTTTSVTITAIPSATISYAGTPFCQSVGTAQAVTQSGTSGGTYSALPSGLSINASTGAIIPSTSTAGTYTVTYTMAAVGGCSAQTATTSVTITALPSATISYTGTPFCKSVGTAQAVTQSGTSGGTYSASPSGLSINASTGAITPSSSTAGAYTVTYTMTASGCSTQTATTSVTITALTSATISYAGTPFCQSVGTAQPVTQSGTSGGTYSALPSGLSINASTGAIIPSTSTAGTYTVTYTMAAAGGCSAQTATTSVTITAIPSATISYSGTPFCKSVGTAQSVTLTGTGGGSFSASPSGLSINSSTGAITPSASTDGIYTVTYTILASGGCALYTTTTSLTVSALSVGGSVGSNASVCSGSNSGTVNLTGQTGNVLNWQYSTNGGTTWTTIANTTTSQTYTNLTQITQYRAVVQSGVCSSANSSAATITVNAASVGGSVSSNATVCSGSNSGTVNLTGQTGSVLNWQYSTDGGTTWTTIANTTTSQTYTNLTQTTQYRAVVQSGVCSSANSSAATITVSALSVGGSVGSNATVCSGTNSGTVNLTGQTGSVLNWQYSTDGGTTWTTIANTTTSQAYTNLTQTTQYRAVVQSGVCSSANSSAATITVSALSVGGSVGSNATVCSGSNSGTVNLTGQTGNELNWQYSTDGGTTWTTIANTTTSQTYTNLTQTTQYRSVVQSGVCSSANSSNATITVNALSVGGSVGSNATVCSGSNSGTVNLTGQTGNVLNWQYSTDGGTTWTTIANTTTSQTYSNLTQTTLGRAVVQNGGCSSANSSAATITVNAASVGGSVGSNATVCSGSNSGTVYLTGQTGTVVNWQYSIDGGSTWVSIANTTTSQTYNNIPETVIGRAIVQNGVCPSANSNPVTITVTPLPSATISYPSSPYCSNSGSATVTITGTSGGTYSSTSGLSINSSSSIINLNASTNGTYTVTYTIAASGGCDAYSTSTNVTITNPGSWTGAVNTDWSNSGNWLCGEIPTSSTNVIIPGLLSNYPNIASGTDVSNNLTIQTGGSVIISGGILQIYGAISNSGTFDATNGTIEMKGTSAQTIDGSMFYNKTINNLIVSNTGSGLSVASTPNDTLKITGTLSFGNGSATLNTGDNITLVSNSAGTANVGIVGSGNTINGNVTVERYINIGTAAGQHAKSWEFLATPTIGQTVKQSWMENGITTSTGYGTMVSGAGGTAAGFDVYTATPSLKYYNPLTNDWTGIANTNISIYNQNGYMVFVRGDRSVTVYNQPPNNTILRTKGTLLTGTLPSIPVLPNYYAAIGNPYASAIDFTLITKGAGIDNKYYVWDPYLYGSYGLGGYQTLSSTNGWEPVPGGTSAYPSGTPTSVVHSGQAFFVHSTSFSPSVATDYVLNFDENNKVSTPPANIISRQFGMAPSGNRQFISTSLYTGNTIADGNSVVFDRNYSDNIDGNDAIKLLNGGENFGFKRDGIILAIEAKAPLSVSDTLFYNMSNLKQQTYQLRFAPENMGSTGLQAYLIDKFLNTSTPISLTDSSFANISITSNPASYAAGRFEMVFRTLGALSVTFTSITAVQKNKDILVSWTVENESGIQQYEVEKSEDGIQFTKVATVAANNNRSGNYSWLDENATSGYQYYRVRSVDKDGQLQYTQIVKVLIGNLDASISVYPNPIVNGTIQIQFSNQVAGVYGIRLMNSLGQIILSKVVTHNDGNSSEIITPAHKLAKGIYQLEIVKPDGNVEVVKIVN